MEDKVEYAPGFNEQLEKIIEKSSPEEAKEIKEGIKEISENPDLGRPIKTEISSGELKVLNSYVNKKIKGVSWWGDEEYLKDKEDIMFDLKYEEKILELFGAEIYGFPTMERVIGLAMVENIKQIIIADYTIKRVVLNGERVFELTLGDNLDSMLVKVQGWDLEDRMD